MSAGASFTCGVRADGTVACWGNNFHGQATPPPGTFTAVSAGGYHACGLKADGTVACWGYNDSGQATPPSGAFTAVTTGNTYSCGLRGDGTVACWGGYSGRPTGTFTALSAGESHTCGVRPDSTVACWGENRYGQATPPSGVPPEATFTAPVAPVTAGQSFTLAFTGANVPGHPEATTFTYAFDCGSGTFGAVSTSTSASCPTAGTTPDGTVITVRGKVIDRDGDATEYTDTVTITRPTP